jgi:hypothetical protein
MLGHGKAGDVPRLEHDDVAAALAILAPARTLKRLDGLSA